MGELICTVIGLLFIFGSVSVFMSIITDKHYHHPVKHSAIDNDLADVMIASDIEEIFSDDQFYFNERLKMNSKSYFLVAAFASFGLSVSLWFLGDQEVAKQQGIFVGLWVPSILTLGTYFCPACDKG